MLPWFSYHTTLPIALRPGTIEAGKHPSSLLPEQKERWQDITVPVPTKVKDKNV